MHVEDFPSQVENEHRTDRVVARVEHHFTPAQLAERLALSQTKIRRMFQDEPGVVKIGEPSRRLGRKLKRRYYTLRIPESVVERVIRRCRVR